MSRILAAAALLALWLAVRHRHPGLRFRLPPALHGAWRYLVPAGALALAASASPAAALGLLAVFTAGRLLLRRSLGHLRRAVAAELAACQEGLAATGRPAVLADAAVCVLLERYAARGMARAEAVALAGRCAHLDDLAAQVALQEGGMLAYAAYLRRYGMTREVADADAAAHGDRFPGGAPPGGDGG